MVQVLLSVTIGSTFFIVDVSLFLEELYETIGFRIIFLLTVGEFQYDSFLPPSKVEEIRSSSNNRSDVSVDVNDACTDDNFSSLSSSLSIDAIVGGTVGTFADGFAGSLLPPPDSPTISCDDSRKYTSQRCDN